MKIKRFYELKESNSEILSDKLKEYYLDLIDGDGNDWKSKSSYLIVPQKDSESQVYFILRGYGKIEEVETFVERVESMERVRSAYIVSKEQGTKILCIDKRIYNMLVKRVDSYFQNVRMEINKGLPYFFYEKGSEKYYIAYESNTREGQLQCNMDFYHFIAKRTFAPTEFVSLFLKLILLDKFNVNIEDVNPKYTAFYDEFAKHKWGRENGLAIV